MVIVNVILVCLYNLCINNLYFKYIFTIYLFIFFVIIDLSCFKYVMQVKLMFYVVFKFWYMKGDIIIVDIYE